MKKLTEQICNYFYPTYYPTNTFINYLNGKRNNGYVEHFEDKEKLAEMGKFRFIPFDKMKTFKDEVARTGRMNVKYSIVISLNKILNISLVLNNQLLMQIENKTFSYRK